MQWDHCGPPSQRKSAQNTSPESGRRWKLLSIKKLSGEQYSTSHCSLSHHQKFHTIYFMYAQVVDFLIITHTHPSPRRQCRVWSRPRTTRFTVVFVHGTTRFSLTAILILSLLNPGKFQNTCMTRTWKRLDVLGTSTQPTYPPNNGEWQGWDERHGRMWRCDGRRGLHAGRRRLDCSGNRSGAHAGAVCGGVKGRDRAGRYSSNCRQGGAGRGRQGQQWGG